MSAPGEEPDPLAGIAIDKRPTKPLNRLMMTLDLENPEAVASFLEAVAASIRDRKRIVLIIE